MVFAETVPFVIEAQLNFADSADVWSNNVCLTATFLTWHPLGHNHWGMELRDVKSHRSIRTLAAMPPYSCWQFDTGWSTSQTVSQWSLNHRLSSPCSHRNLETEILKGHNSVIKSLAVTFVEQESLANRDIHTAGKNPQIPPHGFHWSPVQDNQHIKLDNAPHVCVVALDDLGTVNLFFLLCLPVVPAALSDRLHSQVIGVQCDNIVVLPLED